MKTIFQYKNQTVKLRLQRNGWKRSIHKLTVYVVELKTINYSGITEAKYINYLKYSIRAYPKINFIPKSILFSCLEIRAIIQNSRFWDRL